MRSIKNTCVSPLSLQVAFVCVPVFKTFSLSLSAGVKFNMSRREYVPFVVDSCRVHVETMIHLMTVVTL